jgi:XTP/dITP diphosphohydrolase
MKILLATANTHKVEELIGLLAEISHLKIASLRDFPHIEMPEETGTTMAENARIKAEHCARESGLAALADDSGIEVDALGGAPGVRSARWVEGSDADRTNALLERLSSTQDNERTARYRCAICIAFPDGTLIETEDVCEGRIGHEWRGKNGFGYDPIFEITSATGLSTAHTGKTMAEVVPEEKARVSHRARAVRKAGELLKALLQP